MIKQIHIKNYKLFKSCHLNNIPKILLIGGKNNCGKTSLLEAVFLPLDYQNPDMFTRLLRFRGVDFVDMGFMFTSSYYNFKTTQPIILEYTIDSAKIKSQYELVPPSNQPLSIHKDNIVELKNTQSRPPRDIKISHWVNEESHTSILRPEINGLSLKVNQPNLYIHNTRAVFITSTTYSSVAENAMRYSELDKKNNTSNILSSLQELEPNLKSLSVNAIGKNNIALYGDIGIGQKVHLNLMGQGITRLLSILLGISAGKNGVVLIDELENGFHYSVLPRMWEIITTHAKLCNTQIVATTHSWELISSAIEGIPQNLRPDFEYRRLERNKSDQFKTVDYNFDSLQFAVQSRFETR